MRILGISPAHDSSVCVLLDGEIERFYKEERLSRKKRDKFPYMSLMCVYEEFGCSFDHVVIASPSPDTFFDIGLFCEKIFKCPVEYVCGKHHLQHASLAFYSSGFDRAFTFVIDRNGSNHQRYFRESESIFFCDYPNNFTEIYKSFWRMDIDDQKLDEILGDLKIRYPHCDFVCDSKFNITKVYETATSLISEHPLENGKTMGLSSYGNDQEFESLFDGSIPNDRYFAHKLKDHHPEMPMSVFRKFDSKTCKNVSETDFQFYADYAYQVQKQTQDAVVNLIQKYVVPSAITNICITGGYGLNVVCNSYLQSKFPNYNFFFEPLADDTGNSIGAALLYWHTQTKSCKKFNQRGTFFHGIKHDIPSDYKICDVDFISQQLLSGKAIAVYHGLSESGPRALGNRSILFDCTNKNAKEIINGFKKREWYRPFAGICLEEDAQELFDMLGLGKSEYMTMSFYVREKYRDLISGIVHVDGSCRIQTIDYSHHLYNLLLKIKESIGFGILLNTSFNLAGDPLVDSIQDALDTIDRSDLDLIWFPETNQYYEKFYGNI